jgi:hypothetical protein
MSLLHTFVNEIDQKISDRFSNDYPTAYTLGQYGLAQLTRDTNAGNNKFVPVDNTGSFPDLSANDIGTYHRLVNPIRLRQDPDQGVGNFEEVNATAEMVMIAYSDAIKNSSELSWQLSNAFLIDIPNSALPTGITGARTYITGNEQSNYRVWQSEFQDVANIPFSFDRESLISISYEIRYTYYPGCWPNGSC